MSTFDESLLKKEIKQGSSLKCCICIGILDNPVRIPCGHVFCEVCIGKVGKKECPVDRAAFKQEQVIHDRHTQQIVEELDVVCPLKEKGCKWEGEFGSLMAHKHECPVGEEECQDCKKMYVRADKEAHMIACAVTTTCTSEGCGQVVPLRVLPKHLADECQFAQVPCSFDKYGCKEKMPRKDLSQHTANSSAVHLEMVMPKLATLEAFAKEVEEKRAKELKSADYSKLTKVIDTIDDAIHGTSGGADLYDQGDCQGCYKMYLNAALRLIEKAPEATSWWVPVLQKGADLARSRIITADWGSSQDPAWILRMAFEAVRIGVMVRGEKIPGNRFWSNVPDTHKMLEMACPPELLKNLK